MDRKYSQEIRNYAVQTLQSRINRKKEKHQTEQELANIVNSFPYFLFNYCYTKDEHDPSMFSKPFPQYPYVVALAHILPTTHRLAIQKSRQLLASWICCAFILWLAISRPNSLCFVQSKKEDDAADRLDRIYDIYFRMPEWLRQRFPINLASGRPGQPLHLEMHFTWQPDDATTFNHDPHEIQKLVASKVVRSRIRAIPQGGDILRQFTATAIFSDEAAFQEAASESFTAAAPTLAPDSYLILVSTANPGFFESVCKDRELR